MKKLDLKKIVMIMAIVTMITAIAGMFYYLPFLYSATIEGRVSAGFPFLAGSVMLIGGLISIAIVSIKD
ncbi:hypothetical protein [Sunxiuqinia sp. sy24]|uniref:hypothetical protein n=1 Tax=Sunxiuqinia sp. sy24 TaxID=3461495 RepID=UPI0040458300